MTGRSHAAVAPPRLRLDTAPDSTTALIRHLFALGLAGVTAGIAVGGFGGRLFMRFAAIAAPDFSQGLRTEADATVGDITFGGTLALIIFVGPFAGAVGSFLYAAFRPWLAWAGHLRGLAFGVTLFAVTSASSDLLNPDNIDFFILQRDAVNVSMIVVLFLLYGVAVEVVYVRLDAWIPTPEEARRDDVVMQSMMVVLGAIATGVIAFATMFTNTSCDCDPPLLPAVFALIAAVGTGAWFVGHAFAGWGRVTKFGPPIGFVGLAGALTFGLTRAISDAADIIS